MAEVKKLDAFLDSLMSHAKKAGFTAAEAYVSTGESSKINVFEGEVSESNLSESMGVSFRALINGKVGYASTEALDSEALDMLIDRAKDNANTTQNEDKQFIYSPDADAKKALAEAQAKIKDAHDPSLSALTPAKLIENCLEMERTAKAADPRVLRMSYCMGFRGDSGVRIVNTEGLDVSFQDNIAYFYASPIVQNGEGMTSGSSFWAGNDIKSIDPRKLAGDAVADGLAYIGAKSVPSGNYPVVFRREAMASLLSAFSNVFSAEHAQRGMSLFAGREGQIVASPAVTLIDDPFLHRGYATRPFDDEGVTARVKRVIDGGTLTTLFHNLKTANKQNIETTGNASKASYGSPVSVAPFNFYLSPGDISLDGLLSEMGNGLLITDISGLHAGTSTISGDFSLLAKGFLIENGQISRPVDQITVAGSFFDVLKNVQKTASDLWFDLPGGGAFGSPSVLISGISVAG